MENINFDDYKCVFFENGEVLFKGEKDDDILPLDIRLDNYFAQRKSKGRK